MATTLDLDKQTASFVWQLEEQRKLEKTLLVERVRGTKEGAESVFNDIKTRVAVLEKLNGSASATCIAPIGWSKLIFTGADSVSAPNTIGFGDRDETLCKLDQIRYFEDTAYLRLSANPHYVEHVMPNKSAHARVGANASLWDTLGYVHAGYVTQLGDSRLIGTDHRFDHVAAEHALQLGRSQCGGRRMVCARLGHGQALGDL